ncbi:MAG TPA: DUF2007 domain-containing protein [Actinomycetota bacterium]|nr:DUF2007 domain-containing protein [Actinomycetota bacterium]
MSYRREQGRAVVVATPASPAEAELIKITLAFHGVEAMVSATFSAYPSVDFVEGVRVLVSPEDEEKARDLLEQLRKKRDPGA